MSETSRPESFHSLTAWVGDASRCGDECLLTPYRGTYPISLSPTDLRTGLGTTMKSSRRWKAYEDEALAARQAYARGDFEEAFARLERAHILGQPWAGPHSWTHWMMLRVGWRRGDLREVRGQILRLAVGGILSWFGWLPIGNTGGANVPPTMPMALPGDLAELMEG
jgi:hypothetical protein